jgi:uncharacterized protein YjbJ (UPF0337 family)
MERAMNKIVIDGKWKHIRGEDNEASSQLAGDRLSQAAGKFDKLIGALQEKYGYNRERAGRELNRRTTKRRVHNAARQIED